MSYYEFILILVLVTGYDCCHKKRNNRPASKRERLFLSFCEEASPL